MATGRFFACKDKKEADKVVGLLKKRGVKANQIEIKKFDLLIISKGFVENEGPTPIYSDAIESHLIEVKE